MNSCFFTSHCINLPQPGIMNLQLPEAEYIVLKDGVKYPRMGLGTWKGDNTGDAVKAAIRSGYRFIDTANDYGNEHLIGAAIKELIDAGEITRQELFLQAKLWNGNHRPEHALIDLQKTLDDLQTDYIDAFIIHWPMACPAHPQGLLPSFRKSGCSFGPYTEEKEGGTWMFCLDEEGRWSSDRESHYIETLHAMEDMKEKGLIRTIGVSNFNTAQVRECVAAMRKHPVTITQNEIHPYFQQKDFVDFCAHQSIVVQAFSPLGSNDRPACFRKDSDPVAVLDNEVVQRIAMKHQRTAAQIVLRWHLQRDVCTIPKSCTPSRIQENYAIWDFSLDSVDMAELANLNCGWQFLLALEASDHPDYPFKDAVPHGYVVPKAPQNILAGRPGQSG